MSHMSRLKTKLKNVNIELLKEAIRQIARELGGTIVTHVEDYYGARTKVLIGFKTRRLHRGVGVDVGADGSVEVKGDFWQTGTSAEEIASMVNQRYVANATQIALRNAGFQVTQTKQQQRIYLKAVAW